MPCESPQLWWTSAPWDFIDISVTKEFLQKGMEKSTEENICLIAVRGCSNCGVVQSVRINAMSTIRFKFTRGEKRSAPLYFAFRSAASVPAGTFAGPGSILPTQTALTHILNCPLPWPCLSGSWAATASTVMIMVLTLLIMIWWWNYQKARRCTAWGAWKWWKWKSPRRKTSLSASLTDSPSAGLMSLEDVMDEDVSISYFKYLEVPWWGNTWKRNKKGKLVPKNIRPFIQDIRVLSIQRRMPKRAQA